MAPPRLNANGPTRVLFVCLGNICRSPTAEGVFRAIAAQAGLDVAVDSAGTGSWHVGAPPDPRAIAAAAARGYDIGGLRARQVTAKDFARFDLIVAMDRQNRADLERLRPSGSATPLRLMLDYAGRPGAEVPDPYLEGGFDRVIDLIEAASHGLAESLWR
jgi:protein-tyrosine phosphatase